MSFFQFIWFVLIGVLLLGYTILDGYDLGSGFWYLFTKKDKHRRTILNAVGPFWDGNEVWLLTGGGALFAAFPHVYATVFSAFYLPLMVVLLALIFRAVSIEFRNKYDSPGWRKAWDLGFALGSSLPALLFGVALGNILRGLPIDESMNYVARFYDVINPYSLLFGVTGFAMFAVHGALYIQLKSEGDLAEQARGWSRIASWVYLILFVALNFVTLATQPHLTVHYRAGPVLYVIPILILIGIVFTRMFDGKGETHKAFFMSCLAMAGSFLMIGIGLFPNIVPASGDPNNSLTIANASSSDLTLKVMFVIALIGMPFVIGYQIWAHKVLGGKAGGSGEHY